MIFEFLESQHEAEFIKAIQDFAKSDKGTFLKLFGDQAWDGKAFQKFVKECERQRMDWRPKAGKVSLSHYVLLDGGEVCGYGVMRFPLDEESEREGGNLEFYVPPSKRRQGYGALTLNRLLFEAVRAGLARALVTCPTADEAARKCIIKNRGQIIEDGPSTTARFWIRFR
jgi:predicted acetyltransferase